MSLNNSAKFNMIQLRPVLVPEFSQFSLDNFFGAAHILQGNLLGQIPGLRPVRFHRNDWLVTCRFGIIQINHWQITVAKGTDKTSIPHSKHQTTLLSWITRPRLSFGCTCINASTCCPINMGTNNTQNNFVALSNISSSYMIFQQHLQSPSDL